MVIFTVRKVWDDHRPADTPSFSVSGEKRGQSHYFSALNVKLDGFKIRAAGVFIIHSFLPPTFEATPDLGHPVSC